MAESRTLTIGIDASRVAVGRQTGTERYSQWIIEALLALETPHRFVLYVNSREPLPLDLPEGSRQRLIPFPRLWTHARLSTEMLRRPVDALFIPAHVVPPIHPKATVVTIHDLGYLHEPGSHTGWSRRYLDWSTRWSARAAARVIAISGATRDDLIRSYRIDPDKVAVIPHGVDEQFRPVSDAEIHAALTQLGLVRPYVLFVGTLQPRKNVAGLIHAFDILASERPDLRLVLAGKRGWMAASIDAAHAASPFRDRIVLAGHVPDELLPALYSGAAALALPSLYEGFGLPAIEAMACGTPAVVSDRGSLPEVVGSAAIVVDPTQPATIAAGLARALDSAERSRRAAAGRRHASGYRWDIAACRTLHVIEAAATGMRCGNEH